MHPNASERTRTAHLRTRPAARESEPQNQSRRPESSTPVMTRNLTSGPPTRLIVLFTLPLLVGTLFQQLYAFTDAAVVGRMIGVDALAAVGACGSLQFLLIGFTWGASGGLAIPTARHFGAGDMPAMRRSVAAGALISVAVAAVVSVVGLVYGPALLRLLHTPPELMADASTFLQVTFLGASATVAFNFLAATIRALGDSRTPLVFLVISCVLNAGLVALFIGVLHLGVGGAALATVLAQLVSVGLCLALVARRMPELHLRREDFRLTRAEVGEPAKLGITMGFQMSVIAVGSLMLQYGTNGLGADAVAAFTSAARIDQLAAAPLNSFGLAMATYVAQNRGARQWRRIRVGTFRISLVAMGVAVVLGLVNITLGEPITRLFVGDGEEQVVAWSHQYLVVQGSLYVILALVFVVRNAIQGLGATGVPTIAGFLELAMRGTAGLVLIDHLGFLGVSLAAPLAWVGALVPLSIAWFVRRRHLIEAERLEAEKAERLEAGTAEAHATPPENAADEEHPLAYATA